MLDKWIPRPDQAAAIADVLEDKRHLCRAERGAGKTLIGVEAVLQSGAAVALIVGPLNTRSGWETTFERQSGGTTRFRVIDSTKDGKIAFQELAEGAKGVYFMGWTRFRMYGWKPMPIDFIIYDEVHAGQNRKTGTHTAMKSALHIPYHLGLSATLSGNKVEGQWAIQHCFWSDKEITPAYWPWVSKFLNTTLDPYQGKKINGERVPGTVWAVLPSKSAFASPFQAEPIIYNIEVDLLPAQRKVYDRFEKEAVAWLGERPLVADLPAVHLLRLRQICLAVPSIRDVWKTIDGEEVLVEEVYFEDDAKSTKADAVIEVLSDIYVVKPEPVLIFTHSRKYATMLTKRLQAKGYNARQFIGGMSREERDWKLEAFGTEYDILVATVASIGTGTDGLQDVCNIEFWVSLDDNRLVNKQALGRISRPGQKKTVLRYNFLARNTVEVKRLAQMTSDQEQLDQSYNYDVESVS